MDPEGTVLKSLEEKYWIETKLSNQLNYWVRGKRTNPHGKLAIAEVRTTSVATLTEVISKSHSSIKRTERVSLAYQCSQVYIFLYAYPSALRLNNYTRYFCTNLCISTYLTDWCSQDAAIHFSTAKINYAVGSHVIPSFYQLQILLVLSLEGHCQGLLFPDYDSLSCCSCFLFNAP